MGVLVGALGSSHAPSISFAFDAQHQAKPEWKPFFDAYAPVRDWLRAIQADTLVVVYNDHLNNFQFDNYPSFALGTGEVHRVCGEGKQPRPLPPVPGDYADTLPPIHNQRPPHFTCPFLDAEWKGGAFDRGDPRGGEGDEAVWRHIDSTPGNIHLGYGLMDDQHRLWTLSGGRVWDFDQWPACE